jgi:hypothetical protein
MSTMTTSVIDTKEMLKNTYKDEKTTNKKLLLLSPSLLYCATTAVFKYMNVKAIANNS